MRLRRASGRDVTTIAVVTEGFLSRLGFGVVSLALPLYALHIHMSVTAIGVLLSVNVVIQLVAKPFMGRLADRIGTRLSLILAIAVRSAVPMLLVFAVAPWQLYAIRAAYGIAQSLRDPALNAVIADAGGKTRVGRVFAWYHTAKNTAASVGRAAAGVLLTITAGNYAKTFTVAAAVSVLPLGLVIVAFRRSAVATAVPKTPRPGPGAGRDGSPSPRQLHVAPFTTLAFLFGTTAGMLNLFPVIAKKYLGLGPAQIGIVMLASTVVFLAAGPAFGWVSDNVSRKLVLMVRSVANTVASLLYLALPGFAGAITAKSMDDLGKSAFRPAWGSVMAEVASRDRARRARVMALIDVGEDAGDAIAPTLAGVLLGLGGLPVMLGVRVLLAVITEIWTHQVCRRLECRAEAAAPDLMTATEAAVPAAEAGHRALTPDDHAGRHSKQSTVNALTWPSAWGTPHPRTDQRRRKPVPR